MGAIFLSYSQREAETGRGIFPSIPSIPTGKYEHGVTEKSLNYTH